MVIAIQTFGDFINFNPNCHVLCTDGPFYGSGSFKVAAASDTAPLEKIFQHKVLGMLLRKGKIAEEVIKLIMSWRHSLSAPSCRVCDADRCTAQAGGFTVHCGPRIQPGDEGAMERRATGQVSLHSTAFAPMSAEPPLFTRLRYARRGGQPCPQVTHTGGKQTPTTSWTGLILHTQGRIPYSSRRKSEFLSPHLTKKRKFPAISECALCDYI